MSDQVKELEREVEEAEDALMTPQAPHAIAGWATRIGKLRDAALALGAARERANSDAAAAQAWQTVTEGIVRSGWMVTWWIPADVTVPRGKNPGYVVHRRRPRRGRESRMVAHYEVWAETYAPTLAECVEKAHTLTVAASRVAKEHKG
jgi:hypothetical protein